MAEQSVKEQVKKLIELQKVDKQIFDFQKILIEKPAEIEAAKQAFELKKTKLKELEEKVKSFAVARKDLELELQTKEDAITKANTQLSQIKTNKEYTAKIGEIEGIKADKSFIEEKILTSFDEVDEITAELEKEKEVVAEEEKKFLEQKQAIEEEIKQAQGEIDQIKAQRGDVLSDADPALLARYERILQHKNGIAVVPIIGNTCGGCFMNLTQQTINSVKMDEEVIYCDHCSRILYIED